MLGTALGRYRIVEPVGKGGMGVVYRAHDDHLDRDVALKVLAEGALAGEEARRRFQKEAHALSRLNHPNIASVYDFDTSEGVDLLVMELVPGSSLDQKLSGGALSLAETVDLGLQLVQGLDAAHREGVVHRDLKPGNLRVTPDGRLKILDFGLARMLPPLDTTGPTATLTHTTAGTPPYMAPEQLRGEPADVRTDIHGCGAVLYEMATGRRPFAATSAPLLTDAILHDPPVAPSALNPRISPGLERAILKALQKDPRDRYQSCQELAADLRAVTEPRSQPASGHQAQPVGSDLARGRSRRRLSWGAAGAGVVVTVTVAAWHLSSRPVLSFAPRDFVLVSDVQNATADPVFDRSLTTALRVGLEQSTLANVFSGARVETTLKRMGRTGVEALDETLGREVCQREGVRGLVTASLSQAGSRYALAVRLVDPATGDAVRSYLESAAGRDEVLPALERVSNRIRRDLGESLGAIRQASRPLPRVTTRSLEALQAYADGNHQWEKGKFDEAVQLYERAVALDPEFAKAHAALGSCYMSFVFNDGPKGRSHYDTALKLVDRITDRERLEIEANYHASLGHFDQASQRYTVYLARYPDDLRIQYNYGNLLRDNGRHEEAIARYREALRLDPAHASSHVNIATTLRSLGRVEESLVEYDRAFAIEPSWIVGGNLNHEYGFALAASGDHGRARAVFDRALAAPGLKAKGLRSHALLDMLEGRYASARARLEESALTYQASKHKLSEGRDRLFLSIAHAAQGDRAGSLRQLDRAAGLFAASSTGPPPVWVSRVGVAFVRLKELRRARAQLASLRAVVDETNPADRADLHRLEGEIALAAGHPDEALDRLKVADREALTTPLTIESLAHAYGASGDVDHAVGAYRTLVRDLKIECLGWEPQQACLEGHYELASLLAKQGGTAEAREVLDRLLQLWTNADPVPIVVAARELRRRLD